MNLVSHYAYMYVPFCLSFVFVFNCYADVTRVLLFNPAAFHATHHMHIARDTCNYYFTGTVVFIVIRWCSYNVMIRITKICEYVDCLATYNTDLRVWIVMPRITLICMRLEFQATSVFNGFSRYVWIIFSMGVHHNYSVSFPNTYFNLYLAVLFGV